MTNKKILLIGIGMSVVVFALVLAIMMASRVKDESTLQENTKEIFSEQKIQKIEKTLESTNKQKFSSQEF